MTDEMLDEAMAPDQGDDLDTLIRQRREALAKSAAPKDALDTHIAERRAALNLPAPKYTQGEKFMTGIAQGASLGFGKKILGGLDATNKMLPKALGGESAPLSDFGKNYTATRDLIGGAEDEMLAEHPVAGRVVEAAAGALPMLVGGAARTVVGGAKTALTLPSRMWGSAKAGAAIGAAGGAGHATGGVGDYAKEMGQGAVIGGLIGGAVPPVADVAGAVGSRALTAAGLRPTGKAAAEMASDAATMRTPGGPEANSATRVMETNAAHRPSAGPQGAPPEPTTPQRVRAAFGRGVEKAGIESAKTRALRLADQRFQLDNVSADDAIAFAAKNAKKPVAVLDLGEGNVAGLARTAKDVPSLARREIPKFLNERSAGNDGATLKRVLQDFEDHIGLAPEDYYASLDDMTAKMKGKAASDYGAIRGKVVDDPEVLSLFDEPEFQSIHARLRDNARLGGGPKIEPLHTTENIGGEEVRSLNPQTLGTLDKMKRQLDRIRMGKAESLGTIDKDQAYNMGKRIGDILDRMDEVHPEYGKARANYRGSAEAIDAYESGKTDFGADDPRLTVQKLAKMPERVRDLYRRGQYDALRTRLSKMDDGSNIGAFLEKNPDIRDKVAALAKTPEESGALRGPLGTERAMGDRKNQILGGPNTAERLIEHWSTTPAVTHLGNAARKIPGVGKLAGGLVDNALTRRAAEQTGDVMGEVGKIMTRSGEEGIRLTFDEVAALKAADAARLRAGIKRSGTISGTSGGSSTGTDLRRRPTPPRAQ